MIKKRRQPLQDMRRKMRHLINETKKKTLEKIKQTNKQKNRWGVRSPQNRMEAAKGFVDQLLHIVFYYLFIN
jgi:hypothetical protein